MGGGNKNTAFVVAVFMYFGYMLCDASLFEFKFAYMACNFILGSPFETVWSYLLALFLAVTAATKAELRNQNSKSSNRCIRELMLPNPTKNENITETNKQSPEEKKQK